MFISQEQCLRTATRDQIRNINVTLDKFNIRQHRNLVGETLLRLGNFIQNRDFVPLPTDDRGKALFQMYKVYDSL